MAVARASKTKLQNCRAVVGSDESEVKRAAQALADQLSLAEAGEFGRDVIDGCADNADQAATRIHQTIDALLTLPFFGGEKFVWLKNANFLGDNVMGRASGVVAALEKLGAILGAGLPEDVSFLLSATEVDKRRAFYKTLAKAGNVEVFDKLDTSRSGWEELAAAEAKRRATERQLAFAPEALELFAMLTGGDSRAMENELEKLSLHLSGERREISARDVRLLVPLTRAGGIFELSDALGLRDAQRCLDLVGRLLEQGESAMGILLVAIVPTIRNLLLVKDLMGREKLKRPHAAFHFTADLNRLPNEATAHLPRKKDGTVNGYALGVAAIRAHNFSVEELRRFLELCLETNVKLVTSQLDAEIVLTELLTICCARQKTA